MDELVTGDSQCVLSFLIIDCSHQRHRYCSSALCPVHVYVCACAHTCLPGLMFFPDSLSSVSEKAGLPLQLHHNNHYPSFSIMIYCTVSWFLYFFNLTLITIKWKKNLSFQWKQWHDDDLQKTIIKTLLAVKIRENIVLILWLLFSFRYYDQLCAVEPKFPFSENQVTDWTRTHDCGLDLLPRQKNLNTKRLSVSTALLNLHMEGRLW